MENTTANAQGQQSIRRKGTAEGGNHIAVQARQLPGSSPLHATIDRTHDETKKKEPSLIICVQQYRVQLSLDQ